MQHIKTQQVFLIVSNDTNFEAWRYQGLEEWNYATVLFGEWRDILVSCVASTTCHRFGGLNNNCIISQLKGQKSLKIHVKRARFLLEVVRRIQSLALLLAF